MRTALLGNLVLVLWVGTSLAEFGPAQNLGPTVNSSWWDSSPVLSPDGHMLAFASTRPGGYGNWDLWSSRWVDGRWATPTNMGTNINTAGEEFKPEFSPDGNTLYFRSNRPGGVGALDIYVSEWTGTDWGPAHLLLGPINTAWNESGVSISADGLNMYISAVREAHPDYAAIYVSEWGGNAWGEPARLPGLENLEGDHGCDIGPTGDWMIIDWRPLDSPTGYDLYISQLVGGIWQQPVNLGPEVNSPADELAPRLSSTGGTVVFTSNRPGGVGNTDCWMSTDKGVEPLSFPPGDINCDGVVNLSDIVILINYCLRNGPAPQKCVELPPPTH